MVSGDSPRVEEVRLLVVSPLATGIPPNWLGRRWRDLATATTPDAAIKAVGPGRRRFDVVVVDLMWNDFDDEWRFDGLDVLAAMEASANMEWVVFACQGHGFERDYLDEAHTRLITEGASGRTRGLVLKSTPGGPLDSILAVAAGGTYVDPLLKPYLRPAEQTVHYWFGTSVRLPRFAGVVAAGHPLNYELLAELLHTSENYLESHPALFQEMLRALGEVDHGDPVKLPTVARWCGEHAHYVVSWCRRHGTKIGAFEGMADVFERTRP